MLQSIVTGSGRENGIGAAIATALARNGAAVTIHHVSDSVTKRANTVAERIRADGGKATVVQSSIETPEGAQYLVDQTFRAFNIDHIDILSTYDHQKSPSNADLQSMVNNAGVPLFGETLTVTPTQLTEVLDVNVKGAIFVAQAVVPIISPGGRIVNISSIASKLGDNYIPVYGASKAALDSLTWSWAKEWGRSKGITVNAVAPGPVLTDAIPAAIADDFQRPSIEMTRAANRAGTAEDIADAVLLLVSEKARWITGHKDLAKIDPCISPLQLHLKPTMSTSRVSNHPPAVELMLVNIARPQDIKDRKTQRRINSHVMKPIGITRRRARPDDKIQCYASGPARLEIDPERTGAWTYQESASSLTHYNASIKILRNQIGSAQLMAHEAIIGVVVNLACYDMFTNNLARWKTHMLGLQKMIKYRGGINTLSSQYLQITTIWMDLTGSMILDQPPHLTTYQADLEDETLDSVQKSRRDTRVLLQLLLKLSNLAAGQPELELSQNEALLAGLQAAVYTTLTLPRYNSPDIHQTSLAPCLLTYEIFRLAVILYLSGPPRFWQGTGPSM
ncbi:hypothetical protein FCOIX_5420 [Fusarium coicis]|nr:hypothetical protein FCOIX_5420 [Fusarium coicis]